MCYCSSMPQINMERNREDIKRRNNIPYPAYRHTGIFGVVDITGIRSPSVYRYFLSIQHFPSATFSLSAHQNTLTTHSSLSLSLQVIMPKHFLNCAQHAIINTPGCKQIFTVFFLIFSLFFSVFLSFMVYLGFTFGFNNFFILYYMVYIGLI